MAKIIDLLNRNENKRIDQIIKAIRNAKTDQERKDLKLEAYEIYLEAVKRAKRETLSDENREEAATLATY
ncbi:hypothetical protein [Metabacillus fastidiosus]|uniref:Uncharacterized protein n=1 Tax=Metabacillus fastidiosus TaxID=1458 RepID=A0ABU6NUB4_9BACI|nr:hypothetical protein [Metabacillus fastidiosus]MED4400293.1 hypothetical protein [Metabacillus fastidiosus]